MLIEKIDVCKNDTKNSSTTKLEQQIQQSFSISIILLFKSIENKHDVYKSKDCMKKFEFIDNRAAGIKCKCENLLHL